MKLYLLTIGIAMALISGVNIAFGVASWYYVVISVIWCTALQFALDGAIAIIIRLTPDRYYGVDHPAFYVSAAEKKLLGRLRVRRWKDKVWELGGLGGFSKKHLDDPTNPVYIEKFIIECNKGVVTHRLSYPIGFLAMLTLSGACIFTVALPVAIVNLYLNILPTMVLRYNTPALKRLLTHMRKTAAHCSEEEQPISHQNGN